jgi:hypothetical protein
MDRERERERERDRIKHCCHGASNRSQCRIELRQNEGSGGSGPGDQASWLSGRSGRMKSKQRARLRVLTAVTSWQSKRRGISEENITYPKWGLGDIYVNIYEDDRKLMDV